MPASTVHFDRVGFGANFKDFWIAFYSERFLGWVDVKLTKDTPHGFVCVAIKILVPKHQHPVCVKHFSELLYPIT